MDNSSSSTSWDQPLPFITVDDNDDKFIIHDEAITYLHSLGNARLVIVSIAGMYRTGKSLLLNLLTGNTSTHSNGFAVGGTVRAMTRGLWIWGKGTGSNTDTTPLASNSSSSAASFSTGNNNTDLVYVFLDTEGLGSTIRSETYDTRIFALTLLLSSYFLYNSVGVIDGNAISKLSLIAQLTKYVHVRSLHNGKEDSGNEYAQFFPQLMWIVRDFAVKLEKDGRRISSREYLEDALKPEDGLTDATEQKNAVRMLLRSFFPERDCVTLIRPVTDERQLATLGDISIANVYNEILRPEFRNQVDILRKKIFTTARPKTLYGKPITGPMLVSLATAYVHALNTNSTPTISTAWDRVVEKQCADAVENALILYTHEMTKQINDAARRAEMNTLVQAAKSNLGFVGSSGSGNGGGKSSAGKGSGPIPTNTSTGNDKLIIDEDEMHTAHAQSLRSAQQLFTQSAVQDASKTPAFEAMLYEKINNEYSRIRQTNDTLSTNYCTDIIHTLLDQGKKEFLSTVQGSDTNSNSGTMNITTDSSYGNEYGMRKDNETDDNDTDDDNAQDEPIIDSDDSDLPPFPRGTLPKPSNRITGKSSATANKQQPLSQRSKGFGNRETTRSNRLSSSAASSSSSLVSATGSSHAGIINRPSILIQLYRSLIDRITSSYRTLARGPAQERVLSDVMVTQFPSLLMEASIVVDSAVTNRETLLQQQIEESKNFSVTAKGNESAALELLAQERRSSEAALAEASRQSTERIEKIKFQLETKEQELQRLTNKYERLVSTFEAHSVRADETLNKATVDLAGARARVEEVLEQKIKLLLDTNELSQRLALAENRRAELEEQVGEAHVRLETEAKGVAVLVERVRAAENETVRLREQAELLHEANRVAKEMLVAKNDEREEAEWQWGVTKAKVAALEGEKMALEAELATYESLATAMKACIVKEKVNKKLTLEKKEQKKYDSLP